MRFPALTPRYQYRQIGLAVVLTLAIDISTSEASSYNFNILYFGSNVSTLSPGSDDPVGIDLQPGDDFLWIITAQGGSFWKVVTEGDFFPLMAFGCDPSGHRVGDFTLKLFDSGVEVFSLSDTGVGVGDAHVGTNSIHLLTDLTFDEMSLTYLLTSAVDTNDVLPVDTILAGQLPIFGAPENNQFAPGIAYVPEVSSFSLASFICMAGLAARTIRWQLA